MKKYYKACFLLLLIAAGNRVLGQCTISLGINKNDAVCSCTNGAALVTASGGTAPYTYTWTNNITTAGTAIIYPSKDNSIYEQFTTNSNGAGEFITAGVSAAGFKHRGLLFFNAAANIPPGASITNASLSLNVNLTSGAAGVQNHFLHKVLQNWGEGISDAGDHPGQGAIATVNDATWLQRFFPDSGWTSTGATFNPVSSASSQVDQPGFYTWSSPGMVTDVQAWLNNPATNFGWLIKSDETGNRQAKRYCSRENATVQNRPVLTINYLTTGSVIGTGSFISNLPRGSYTVTVTDAVGCTASIHVIINSN
jgi:SprB repeat